MCVYSADLQWQGLRAAASQDPYGDMIPGLVWNHVHLGVALHYIFSLPVSWRYVVLDHEEQLTLALCKTC